MQKKIIAALLLGTLAKVSVFCMDRVFEYQMAPVNFSADHKYDCAFAGSDQSPPLLVACANGQIQRVKLLLAAGADVDFVDSLGNSALLQAFENGHTQIVKLLLACGAELPKEDKNFEIALHFALERGYAQLAELVITLPAFVDNPLEQITAITENRDDYFVWSIAYKKDHAYSHLSKLNPDLLATTKSLVHFFLLAARVGNVHVLNALAPILRQRKPEGFKFVYLKAWKSIVKLHPELSYLLEQVVAEDIAPSQVGSLE